jgi:pimeloyl-ACP methyl ester carboxylesterase
VSLRRWWSGASSATSSQRAADRVFLPIAIGQILASAETLSLKRVFDDDGYLRGVSAQQYPPGSLRRRLARALDHPRTPKVLAGVTLAASTGLALARGNRKMQIAAAAVIGTCNRLSEIRTPYGRDGADQMTAVIVQYRALTALMPDRRASDDLSFARSTSRRGSATPSPGCPRPSAAAGCRATRCPRSCGRRRTAGARRRSCCEDTRDSAGPLTIGTVAWEVASPCVYLLPREQASYALAAVKLFHAGVAATMELPRFVWGFLGSHGAVGHVLDTRGERRTFEKAVVGIAGGVTVASALIARERRRVAERRRLGPKGATRLRSDFGVVEYVVNHHPDGPDRSQPVIVLECGLGQSLDSWEWVAEALAPDHTVIRYHRPGYGFTRARASSGDLLGAVLDEVGAKGEVVVVTHSIGSLSAASYAAEPRFADRVRKIVVVDGTDPDLLEADRTDRRRFGKLIQSQVHTLFAALTGIHEWAPNSVERQAGYTPDTQYSHVQFVFSPKNIINSVREYTKMRIDGALANLRAVDSVLVVASGENAEPQSVFARKLGAGFEAVDGSAHRSIIGHRNHAEKVEDAIRRFIHAG